MAITKRIWEHEHKLLTAIYLFIIKLYTEYNTNT